MRKMYFDKKIGYWVIYLENNKRTCLHHWLMEQFLGRKLLPTENVHHINEDKLDNRIENLEVLSAKEHTKKHHCKPFKETHEERKCVFCGKVFFALKRKLRSKTRKTPYIFCSRSCGAKMQWKEGRSWKNNSVSSNRQEDCL